MVIGVMQTTVEVKETHLHAIDAPDYNGSIEELRIELDEAMSSEDFKEVDNQENAIKKELDKVERELKSIQQEALKIAGFELKKEKIELSSSFEVNGASWKKYSVERLKCSEIESLVVSC